MRSTTFFMSCVVLKVDDHTINDVVSWLVGILQLVYPKWSEATVVETDNKKIKITKNGFHETCKSLFLKTYPRCIAQTLRIQ